MITKKDEIEIFISMSQHEQCSQKYRNSVSCRFYGC